jgi:hypothetical protein
MTLRSCPRQPEVQRLLVLGHYPQAATPELRAHLVACRSCADLVLITQAFQHSRSTAQAQAHLPAPGVLWSRAHLRRRNAAVQRVARPILGAQIFALALTLCVAVVFVVTQARHGLNWLSWFGSDLPTSAAALHLADLWPSTLASTGWGLTVLIPTLATAALLSAVALYLAAEKQ